MEEPVLKDPDQYPDAQVLKDVLKEHYSLFRELETAIAEEPCNLTMEWKFYKDGKAWLCKVLHKKKTVFWLSVITTGFSVVFYFNEKNFQGVFDLPVSESIKESFQNTDLVGKLHPLIEMPESNEQLKDIFTLIEYKKRA